MRAAGDNGDTMIGFRISNPRKGTETNQLEEVSSSDLYNVKS